MHAEEFESGQLHYSFVVELERFVRQQLGRNDGAS